MSQLISVAEALERIRAATSNPGKFETATLEDALGRRLSEDVHADAEWPVTDRSAMDGFACATEGAGVAPGQRYPVVGAALAGHPFEGPVAAGSAVRIMTGAVVPEGADTVVMVEDTSGYDTDPVEISAEVAAGANIRHRGSEIAAGALLIPRGTRIRAAEIGALAVLGMRDVDVFVRPRVAILSTGDEVVPIDREPSPHQVRDSNAWALGAQIAECGGEAIRLGIASDEAGDLRARLEDGLARAEIVLTIGGVSKGTHDLVHGTLAELGVEEVFHGITMKPGKPLFFGRQGSDGPFVFGLPGNPASAFTTFHLFVRPLLQRLAGASGEREMLETPLAGTPFRKNWRAQAIPARLVADEAGLAAAIEPARPSGDPFGLCRGDGFVMIPADTEPGDIGRVEFVPYGDSLA